jgi:methyltransferase (TIGR00027 family)
MGGAKRSRSAQAVAVERAVLTDLGAIDDPYAETVLDPTMARILWGVRRLVPAGMRRGSVTLAGLAARVRWHDAVVTASMDEGIDQVVVVGAGYDSRAWRLARGGVRFFELDHPLTQADKVHRAPAGSGPTFVAADLGRESAADALRAGGLDPTRPAVFVLEGLTMYLTEDAVRRQMSELAAGAAPGSRLTTDFYPPQDAGSSRNRRQNVVQRLARSGSGEDLHLTIDCDGARSLAESTGWTVTASSGAREAARSLVPPAVGLSVDAVNDRKTLLAARR